MWRVGVIGLHASLLLAIVLTTTLCLSHWRVLIHSPPPDARLVPSNDSSLPPPWPYPINDLPDTDRNVLIDVKHFDYHINNLLCDDTDSLLLLVLVLSAPKNFRKRQTIRNTWGKSIRGEMASSHKVLFLLGEVTNTATQNSIYEENREHHDIIQGCFRDTYRNLTYKHVMALKWTTYHCSGARYLLRSDDDVFVNLPTLIDFLSRLRAHRLIICQVLPYLKVDREYSSKWYVSRSEYPGRHYPSYCAGWAVLYSPDVVFLLYKEAQRAEYFWIDDVHITGTLAARANLTRKALGPLMLTDDQVESLTEDSRRCSALGVFFLGPPNISQSSIHKLWNLVKEPVSPVDCPSNDIEQQLITPVI